MIRFAQQLSAFHRLHISHAMMMRGRQMTAATMTATMMMNPPYHHPNDQHETNLSHSNHHAIHSRGVQSLPMLCDDRDHRTLMTHCPGRYCWPESFWCASIAWMLSMPSNSPYTAHPVNEQRKKRIFILFCKNREQFKQWSSVARDACFAVHRNAQANQLPASKRRRTENSGCWLFCLCAHIDFLFRIFWKKEKTRYARKLFDANFQAHFPRMERPYETLCDTWNFPSFSFDCYNRYRHGSHSRSFTQCHLFVSRIYCSCYNVFVLIFTINRETTNNCKLDWM